MMEVIVFAALTLVFFAVIQKQPRVKQNKITVGEKTAISADNKYNVYEGEIGRDQVEEMLKKAERLSKAGA